MSVYPFWGFMIEDIMEEVTTVTMLIYIKRKNGLDVLSKTVDENDVIKVLYIPKLDLSLHSIPVGSSPNGEIYTKFFFNLRDEEEFLYSDIVNDFFVSGWSLVTVD
jgi:hypothetical protein